MSQVISKIANRTSVKFYALVLGAALALTPVAALATDNDLDDDGVNDKIDNCIPWSDFPSDRDAAYNPRTNGNGQPDTDNDGIGNRCDCDFNNDDIVGLADVGLFTQVVGSVDTDRYPGETSVNNLDLLWGEETTTVGGILVTPELMDHNADGLVNEADFNILLDYFGSNGGPGPSGIHQ
jgi:hypothetical protein